MDLEQLKLVIELLREVGSGSKELIVFWIFVKEVIPTIVVVGFGIPMLVLARNILYKMCFEESFAREIRDMLEIGSSGEVTDLEKRLIVARIKHLAGKRS